MLHFISLTRKELPMDNNNTTSRRQFMKIGFATLAAIPLLAVTGNASAKINAGMRSAMKYQDKTNGDKSCSTCMQFVPGKTPADLGGCKLFAGDTEVSPKGSCAGWVAKPK